MTPSLCVVQTGSVTLAAMAGVTECPCRGDPQPRAGATPSAPGRDNDGSMFVIFGDLLTLYGETSVERAWDIGK